MKPKEEEVPGKVQILIVLALLLIVTTWYSTCDSGPIFEEPGALTVGFQGQYGMLAGDALAADRFDTGPGYAFRLRYYLGENRALGVSLESQHFEGVPDAALRYQPVEMNVAIFTLDYLWYFGRKEDVTRYVTVGAGIHHPGREYDDGTEVGPDGLVVAAGAGLEAFVHRVVSIDLCVKVYGMFGQDGILGSGEAAAGLNFYIID